MCSVTSRDADFGLGADTSFLASYQLFGGAGIAADWLLWFRNTSVVPDKYLSIQAQAVERRRQTYTSGITAIQWET